MRLLGTLALLGLTAAGVPAQDPPKADKATVELTGQMAGTDATLSYTLKKDGKVVAEGKDVSALPAKAEIDAAAAAGPFELTLAVGDKGAVRLTQLGLTVTSGGKTAKAAWGGPGFELGTKDPLGRVVKSVTIPLAPVAVPESKKDKDGKGKKDGDKKGKDRDKNGTATRLPVAPPPAEK